MSEIIESSRPIQRIITQNGSTRVESVRQVTYVYLTGGGSGGGGGAVDSVNGQTGIVVLDTGDISEGSNLYYTEARVAANTDVAANTAARHTHSNKTVIDDITNAGSGVIISSTERSKLSGIEAGAQVNTVDSVNGQTGVVVLDYSDVGAAAASHSHVTGDISDWSSSTLSIYRITTLNSLTASGLGISTAGLTLTGPTFYMTGGSDATIAFTSMSMGQKYTSTPSGFPELTFKNNSGYNYYRLTGTDPTLFMGSSNDSTLMMGSATTAKLTHALGLFTFGEPVTVTGDLATASGGSLIIDGDITSVGGTHPFLDKAQDLADVSNQQAALDNLTAVSGATDEYVLTKDTGTGNATWKAASTVAAINDLTDVVITSPADNEVLAYDTSSGNWVNQTPAEAGLATASDLSTHTGASAAHGATGAIVGTTNTQTLTNKTLTTPTIGDFTNATHDHSNAAGGGTISHTNLTSIGTKTHAQIDTHLALTNEHIDWTNASANFLTTGTLGVTHSTSGTAIASSFALTHTVSGFDSGVFTGVAIDGTIDIAASSIWTGGASLLDLSLQLVDNGLTVSLSSPRLINGSLDLGGVAISSSSAPCFIEVINPESSQAFTNGAFRVNATGGSASTGEVIGIYSSATAQYSGPAYGYKGYAGSVAAATGEIVGVLGAVYANGSAVHSAVVGVEGQMLSAASTPADKRMAGRFNSHVLIKSGSLFVTSTTSATPNALSMTHLNALSNKGELYVSDDAEIDGELFCDGNETHSINETSSTSVNAGTDTYIICDATSGNVTVNLPAISGLIGREYVIKKIDSGSNTVTVDGNSSETIDGATTQVLSTQYDYIRIVAGTSEWYIVG